MTHYWPFQDAKAQLSELVRKAQTDGRQFISVLGEPTVVVISQKEYESLTYPHYFTSRFFSQITFSRIAT